MFLRSNGDLSTISSERDEVHDYAEAVQFGNIPDNFVLQYRKVEYA